MLPGYFLACQLGVLHPVSHTGSQISSSAISPAFDGKWSRGKIKVGPYKICVGNIGTGDDPSTEAESEVSAQVWVCEWERRLLGRVPVDRERAPFDFENRL